MNIRAWRAARPRFLHHIQRVASRGYQDFRQFEELAGCFFQPAILCSTHHEALSVADFIMQVIQISASQSQTVITRFCISPAVQPYAPKPAASGNFLFFTGTFFSAGA